MRRVWCEAAASAPGPTQARSTHNLMRVLIPTPLRSYTRTAWIDADGTTLAEVLADLDRRFPGIRFRVIDEQDRMRRHMRFFVNGTAVFDLSMPLAPTDELCLVQALSGG